MAKKMHYTVTFLTPDKLINLFSQETEKYQFETELNNIIVKIIDANNNTISYDFLKLPSDQEVTLDAYLKQKIKNSKKKYTYKQKKETWHSPDTDETLTLFKVEGDIACDFMKILVDK